MLQFIETVNSAVNNFIWGAAMAAAVCQSPARRVLVPINHCENIVVGVPDQPIGQLVAAAAQKVKELVATPCK